jgi:hypothetical protein
MNAKKKTQTITLKGAKIAGAGRFTSGSWWSYEQKIAEGGGEVVKVISDKLTCFVAGGQAGAKAGRAAARGVPILTEAQLKTLLKAGKLTLKEEEATKQTFDESVAELRGIFGAAPTSPGWTRCLEIVEACDPERLDDLISYVEPFIDGWDALPMPRWEPPKEHALMANAPIRWRRGNPDDELRVAPPAWLYELFQGRYSAKHAIVRALNMEGLMLNGGLGEAMIKSPHLRGIRFIGLGSKTTLPTSFYVALGTSALCEELVELWLSTGHDSLMEAWADERGPSFGALRRVRSYNFYVAHRRRLPCFGGADLGGLSMYKRV